MDTTEKKSKKKIVIIAACAFALVAIGVICFFFFKEEKGYRTIQIYEMNGDAVLTRKGIEDMEAYENLMLKTEDKLLTKSESTVRLKMDSDKFMLLEPDTEVELYATGDSENSKTDINLNKGCITIEIKGKLKGNSTYRVTTPNSVMAVRGTVFRVEVTYDENGKCVTIVTVYEGSVAVEKKDEDGNVSDKVILKDGKRAIIKEEEGILKIILEDEIPLAEVSVEALEFLKGVIEDGRELSVTLEEVEEQIRKLTEESNDDNNMEENAEPYNCTVTFVYKGQEFGRQDVMSGELIQKPLLTPDGEGDWDHDFSVPVVTDTAIEFK